MPTCDRVLKKSRSRALYIAQCRRWIAPGIFNIAFWHARLPIVIIEVVVQQEL
jgi:hypothetical protein